MNGTAKQVNDVCSASPSCVAELMPLINNAVDLQCEDAEFVLQQANDIEALTKYFCTGNGNCYNETKAFLDGDIASVECECLYAVKEMSAAMSDEAKAYLGVTNVTLAGVDAYITLKDCAATATPPDPTSMASVQKIHAAAFAILGTTLYFYMYN